MSIIRNPEQFWEKVAIRAVIAGILGVAFLNIESEIEKKDPSPSFYDSGSEKLDVFSDDAKGAGYVPSFSDQNSKILGRMIIDLNLSAAEQDTNPVSCIVHLTNALEASRVAGVPIPRTVDC